MAKHSKKSSSVAKRLLLRPAAWYSNLPNAAARDRELIYINTTVKLLRQYFTGFDASDGYDLRYSKSMSWQRLNHINKYGSRIHALTASPHYRAVACTKKEREVLTKYTGQVYKGKNKPRAFVVHHPEAAYRDIKVKVNKQGRVTLTKKVPGMTTKSQVFMFVDYGFNPKTFITTDHVIKAIKKMIATKDMPKKGNYQFETELHGPIWYTMERDDIILNLQDFGNRYTRSPDFSRGLIGLRYYVDKIAAEILDETKTERLAERKKIRDRFKHSKDMRKQVDVWSGQFYESLLKKAKRKKARRGK